MQQKTVYKWIHRFEDTNTIDSPKKSGRPRCTTADQDAIVINHIRENPFSNCVVAANLVEMKRSTARRRIKESTDLKCYRAANTIKLTDDHRARRMLFCQQMLNDRDNEIINFENIVFTDEKTFCTDVNHAKLVYRPPNSRNAPPYISTHGLSGRISGGYWGWISVHGPGELVRIGARFNSHLYREILEDVAIPTIDLIFDGHAQVHYMHDNSRIHRAKIIEELLPTFQFRSILDWPANSPDLNPIERVWAETSRDWQSIEPRNVETLDAAVMRRWDELRANPGYFQNLYDGLANRFQYVIDHNGHFNP